MQPRWKTIKTAGWEREGVFEGFKSCEFPFLVIGANVQARSSIQFWKEKKISPYIACVYAVCRAANDIPAFRQRIRGDALIEHETIHADFTVAQGTGSLALKMVAFEHDFAAFYKSARSASDADFSIAADLTASDHWLFMSCLPWISFTHVIQPVKSLKSDCIPRIVWGKFSNEGLMPISVQAHHALVDGLHVAQFLEKLEAYLSSPETSFGQPAAPA